MTLQTWSELLYEYYFKPENSTRVMLHITMQDLINFAKYKDAEIVQGRKASEYNYEIVKNDFVKKFWLKSNEINRDITDLINKINKLKKNFIVNKDYKSLLAIAALFIMPICENDDLVMHGNEYYGHLRNFLTTNLFVENCKNDDYNHILSAIHLDEIWHYLDRLAENESLPYKSGFSLAGNGAKGYVRSLMKESLLSPSKIQKFCIIFDKGGFVPRINIEDQRLLSAFGQYYNFIGISETKYKSLTNKDYKEYLTNALRAEYDNWDGTTKIKERDNNTGKIKTVSNNTCYPLLLYMDYNANSNRITKFALQLFCADIDDMDYMSFVYDSNNKELPQVYIKNNGYANRPFEIDENTLNDIFANQEVFGIHEQDNESLKGRFVVTDYYLMKTFNNKYVATNEYVKGAFYFAVIRNKVLSKFDSWLKVNDADLIDQSLFGGLYSAYRIKQAKEDLKTYNNLRFKTEIRCKGINNFEIKTDTGTEVVCLSKHFLAQFEISGVDVSNDRIYAVSINGNRISSELEYNPNKGLWILGRDTFPLDREFTLFHNETPILYCKTFKFCDFVLPHSFDELPLDKWGMLGTDTLTEGLRLLDNITRQNLTNWKNMSEYMSKADSKSLGSNDYTETDYLLYAITSASYDRRAISIDWLKNIKDRLASECENHNSNADKYALYNTLADFFRMGYINYTYTDKGLCITANRPTLILLPPEFARRTRNGLNGKTMVSFPCVDDEYKCLLTGGRTAALIREIEKLQSQLDFKLIIDNAENYLMPQSIYVYAKQHEVFNTLAEKCNLLYQDSIYANALVKLLPSVGDYINKCLAEGTETNMFGVNNFRAIDYKRMSDLYPQKLADGKIFYNSEIDKKQFDRENDVVSFFPGTKDETSVMIKDGIMTEVDKYWGHFIGMLAQNAKVLQYDKDQAKIFLPLQIRLPLLYARALTLTTGKTPDSVSGSRAYNVANNPFAPDCKAETILQKLGQ